jgi:Ca-activated chloride channel family protein
MVVALFAAIGALLFATLAELLHVRRCRRLAPLAFGPAGRPKWWTFAAPPMRVLACGTLAWALVVLLTLEPKVHQADAVAPGREEHVVLVLDVSPSMRLEDAGPELKQSRRKRAAVVLKSFFDRIPMERNRVSVVAVYNGAKVVVEDSQDFEVVRNILDDLPMEYAFNKGETTLFAGLEEAVRIAKPWNPRSATVVLVSDGDTVPGTGMPKLPASVKGVLVVGVGDPRTGKFLNGRHSRQDVATLRQIAARLGGVYHNGNQRHLSTETLDLLLGNSGKEVLERLTLREYALAALGLASLLLALLPVLLHRFGSTWAPGVPTPRPARAHTTPSRGCQIPVTTSASSFSEGTS